MRRVLILGLDTFAAKNVAQLRVMNRRGYSFDVVTDDSMGESSVHFGDLSFQNSLRVLSGSVFRRLWTVQSLLRGKAYHHAELYPASIFGWLYVLMLRGGGIPFLVVERGDVGFLDVYDALTRRSLLRAYRGANAVVYKEPFMESLLARYAPGKAVFLPNAVEAGVPTSGETDPTQFLWVNRIIRERRADWVASAFQQSALRGCRLTVVGLLDESLVRRDARAAQQELLASIGHNVRVLPFQPPKPFFSKATFFCLAAEKVFGNNALLEAMSHGLIPIVTTAPGVDRVIEDGRNGIVTAFEKEAYTDGLVRAARLTSSEIRAMSVAARETVAAQYSIEAWAERLSGVYDLLGTSHARALN